MDTSQFPTTFFDIVSAAVTDRGLSEKRPENEDSYLDASAIGLFCVADGVGGAQAGEIASQMATDIISEAFVNAAPGTDDADVMAIALTRANDAIFNTAQELPQLSRMATTIVALKITGDSATIGHVGDSRIYRVSSEGELIRETDDHSFVADEVRAGRLTESEAENHPGKNVISRALGADAVVEPEIKTVTICDGDSFLLCSDGITRHVTDAEIKGVMTFGGSPEDICRYLKDTCFERGAEDNLTAVVVRLNERSPWNETISELTDNEDTVPTARTISGYAEVEDDILEIGGGVSVGASVPEISLADELLGEDLHETIPNILPEPEQAQDLIPIVADSGIAQDAEEPKVDVVAEPAFSMFGASENDYGTNAPSSSGMSRALFAGLCIVIGGLIGMAAYHFGFSRTAEVQPVPPVLEMRSENIPFSSFEKNRRNVDTNPSAYLAELPPPEDAEDHYLSGRAYLLTGDLAKARQALTDAKAKLAASDAVNAVVIRTEINLMLAVLDDPVALKKFQSDMSAPK